jgi:hypothetical protein
MPDRIIAITGNRNLSEADIAIISAEMWLLVSDSSVKKVYFGGARGADDVALVQAFEQRHEWLFPKLVLVVPNKVKHQPRETHDHAIMADEVVELGLPITPQDFYAAYMSRNRYMVDRATEVVAFWSGDKDSGTYKTMEYAKAKGLPVHHVKIEGKDK